MATWFFSADLHGSAHRSARLLERIEAERPEAVLLGGDLLPNALTASEDFLTDDLGPRLSALRGRLGGAYPRLLVILGNDDPAAAEPSLFALASEGLLEYIHGRRVEVAGRPVYGYACVPPTPFLLKDFERYDVSRYVDPGAVSPEEGFRSVPLSAEEAQNGTIAADLAALAGDADLADAVFLFHAPPYQTRLDRAALDGMHVDHAPLDVHIGSIGIRRFLEARGPQVSLHGHVHESVRLTGSFQDRLGRTVLLGGANDGPELALVRFDPATPEAASRELL